MQQPPRRADPRAVQYSPEGGLSRSSPLIIRIPKRSFGVVESADRGLPEDRVRLVLALADLVRGGAVGGETIGQRPPLGPGLIRPARHTTSPVSRDRDPLSGGF